MAPHAQERAGRRALALSDACIDEHDACVKSVIIDQHGVGHVARLNPERAVDGSFAHGTLRHVGVLLHHARRQAVDVFDHESADRGPRHTLLVAHWGLLNVPQDGRAAPTGEELDKHELEPSACQELRPGDAEDVLMEPATLPPEATGPHERLACLQSDGADGLADRRRC